MNNRKCPYCGFINFVTAESCRKCETYLLAKEEDLRSSHDQPAAYRGGVSSYRQPYPTKSGFTLGKALLSIAGLAFGAIIYTVGIGLIRGYTPINWIAYHPDGPYITVMMPNQPTRHPPMSTTLPTGSVSMHMFMSEVLGQGAVAFSYADYSGVDLNDSSQVLDNSLNGLLTKSNSTLVSKNSIDYQGMPGLEFEVTPPASAGIKNGRCYGKILLSASYNRLYLVMIAASENSNLLAGKDKVLNPTFNDGLRPAIIKLPPIPPLKLTPPPIQPFSADR